MDNANVLTMAADIVKTHLGHNSVPIDQIPAFIQRVYDSLANADKPANDAAIVDAKPAEIVNIKELTQTATAPLAEKLVPAVPIKKSVTDDNIICLEDGLPFKSMKRHLQASYGMTPEQYRAKWGLPSTYPMVCKNYSVQRSALAKTNGLGRGRAKAAQDPSDTVAVETKAETKKKTNRVAGALSRTPKANEG